MRFLHAVYAVCLIWFDSLLRFLLYKLREVPCVFCGSCEKNLLGFPFTEGAFIWNSANVCYPDTCHYTNAMTTRKSNGLGSSVTLMYRCTTQLYHFAVCRSSSFPNGPAITRRQSIEDSGNVIGAKEKGLYSISWIVEFRV